MLTVPFLSEFFSSRLMPKVYKTVHFLPFVLCSREVWRLMLGEESRHRMFELRVLMGLLKRRVCMQREAANGCVIRIFIICVVNQIKTRIK